MATNYLVAPTGTKITTVEGDFEAAALAEPGANGVEAAALTVSPASLGPDWAYNASAEDNGTAGNLDTQPGVVYGGPAGFTNHARVSITGFNLDEHAITAPEAEDTVTMALWVNSTLAGVADEGFVNQAEAELEFNIDTIVSVDEGDVVRVGIYTGRDDGGAIEADADWVIVEGGEWSIS